MKRTSFITLTLLTASLLASAQSLPKTGDDFGIWTDIAVEKALSKKASVELEAEYRSEDKMKQNSRWAMGVSGEYKITKWLKADVGYTFIYKHNEKYTYHYDAPNKPNYSKPNKYAEFWGTRHRVNVALTGSLKLSDWKLSLRERWQYTYRPEKTIEQRYDFDKDKMDGKRKTYKAKSKNQLRSRLQVVYSKKELNIEPYANVELYNAWSLEKVRYTVGLNWDFIKRNTLGVYYRYQDNSKDDDDTRDTHILGVSYKIKF